LEIETAIIKYPTKFDMKTVKSFAKELETTERPGHHVEFHRIIRKEESRIEEAKYERLQEMANALMKNDDGSFKLHQGFYKNCGLRGGLLSGG
jgi:ABC-type multidrug transport system fused ATPase/permease subunit